jgi:hypothetical protein
MESISVLTLTLIAVVVWAFATLRVAASLG